MKLLHQPILSLRGFIYQKKNKKILRKKPFTSSSSHKETLEVTREIKRVIKGITQGYKVNLELNGIGYQARLEKEESENRRKEKKETFIQRYLKGILVRKLDQKKEEKLLLDLGNSHTSSYKIHPHILIRASGKTLFIHGISQEHTNQVAGEIEKYKKCEPYKGKGIRNMKNKVVIKTKTKK